MRTVFSGASNSKKCRDWLVKIEVKHSFREALGMIKIACQHSMLDAYEDGKTVRYVFEEERFLNDFPEFRATIFMESCTENRPIVAAVLMLEKLHDKLDQYIRPATEDEVCSYFC